MLGFYRFLLLITLYLYQVPLLITLYVDQVVSFCEVATGNTAVNADGALVKGDGGELCVAHNGYGGQGVIVSIYTVRFIIA